jgi:hypothetical protein
MARTFFIISLVLANHLSNFDICLFIQFPRNGTEMEPFCIPWRVMMICRVTSRQVSVVFLDAGSVAGGGRILLVFIF